MKREDKKALFMRILDSKMKELEGEIRFTNEILKFLSNKDKKESRYKKIFLCLYGQKLDAQRKLKKLEELFARETAYFDCYTTVAETIKDVVDLIRWQYLKNVSLDTLFYLLKDFADIKMVYESSGSFHRVFSLDLNRKRRKVLSGNTRLTKVKYLS